MWFTRMAFLSVGLLLVLTIPSSPTDTILQQSIEQEGWQMIPGGEGTSCAGGDPYSFFARTGNDSKNVILYLQAGGACWSAESCLLGSPLPIYDQTVTAEEFSSYGGIFDFEHPDNPVRAYDMVFVPLCTGDAHVGDAQVTYSNAADQFSVTINHYGARNVRAALDWLYDHYPDPERVWVIGSSAGSLASMYYYPYVAEHYPNADVAMFGDGYLGIVPAGFDAMQRWNVRANLPTHIPALATLDLTRLNMADIMDALTQYYAERRFAVYSHASDVFQLSYYGLTGGDMTRWHDERHRLLNHYADIANLHYYLGEGFLHTILAFDEFYTMTTDGVAFRDWFSAFLDGAALTNVSCARGTALCP